jgi:hypothetical protein
LHVLGLEKRVVREDRLRRPARGEHSENVLGGEPLPANDRLVAEDLRVDRDPLERFALVYGIDSVSVRCIERFAA